MAWFDFAICLCCGFFGVHKFMEHNKKMGWVYLCTMGLFGIGWLYDCIVYFSNARKGQRSLGKMSGKQLHDDEPLPTATAMNVPLHKGEVCHYTAPATHIKTKNVVVGYSGGSRGVSIRIMKGVSYRVGASKSQPIRGNIQEKTQGVFTITNKRIIFSANKGSFDKKITSLSSIIPHSDGITFQFSEQQYPLMLTQPTYVGQIIARIVNTSEE